MHDGIPGWTPDLERSFKEILFRFLEEVQSTKAALYLLSAEGSYVLVTQYGFGRRDQLAAEHGPQDQLVRRVRELRNQPWAANHPDELPGIARYLEAAGTARLLLVPMYAASRVVGFVDARDKGRRASFDSGDLQRARGIAEALMRLVQGSALYPELSGESGSATATPEVAVAARPEEPTASPAPKVTPAMVAESPIDGRGVEVLLDAARDALRDPQVTAVAFSVVLPIAAATVLLAREVRGGVDPEPVLRHQRETLAAAGIPTPDPQHWRLEVRRARGAAGEQAQLIASDLVIQAAGWRLVVSVIGAMGAPAARLVLERLRRVAEEGSAAALLRADRFALVRGFLEPGLRRHSLLVAHSLQVSRLSWMIARVLSLPPDEVENAAVAGLLHDVGMRELEYERLYRHRAPSSEDRHTYQQHPTVGAGLLLDAGLKTVAAAVRHHHERWDGGGYPDHLAGDGIPLLSRVVHLAEVYDVLTSAESYRPAVDPERALAIIRSAAGQQFDPSLVPVLQRALP